MTRYFYTDPVKAIWMIRNFDFKLQQTYDGYKTFECVGDGDIASQLFEDNPQENWLHPNCHEMLKPQEGDLMEYSRPTGGGGGVYWWELYTEKGHEHRLHGDCIFHIVQRNGTAFFMPEVEGD